MCANFDSQFPTDALVPHTFWIHFTDFETVDPSFPKRPVVVHLVNRGHPQGRGVRQRMPANLIK